MEADFDVSDLKELPQFNLLLGDFVYSFGESQYYYDQFYEPYRNPPPIYAVAVQSRWHDFAACACLSRSSWRTAPGQRNPGFRQLEPLQDGKR